MNTLTDQLNIRIDHQLRIDAEHVLKELGIKTADAIRMFLTQVSLTKSFPLELKIPNKTTIAAIEAGERGEVTKTDLKGLKDMFGKL
ncbi:MAG TPA: type II toxin-antitoxin system RelB/DinJ family antitoxin [Aquella sp.]|nr:type II toxin-antitoxin system RelB/DinJ family antitoxin [Aquella sp.]